MLVRFKASYVPKGFMAASVQLFMGVRGANEPTDPDIDREPDREVRVEEAEELRRERGGVSAKARIDCSNSVVLCERMEN